MVKMIWYDPPRKKCDKLYEKLVSFEGVGLATHAKALEIGKKAEAILAPHHAHNAEDPRPDSKITVTRGAKRVDAFVNLKDPDGGALAIEAQIAPLRKAAFGG